MNGQLRFKISFIIIIVLCWIDYQYFTEGLAHSFSPVARQAGHFIILAGIMLAGYAGWIKHEETWMKRTWLAVYAAGMFIIANAGILQYQFQLFPVVVLDKVSVLRLFLSSPVPYFILYIIHRVNPGVIYNKV